MGAQFDGVGANVYQGTARVYVRSNGAWTPQQTLIASDGAANDMFGASVAISGDTIVAGAGGDTIGANANQGSAYVFAPYSTLEDAALTIDAPGVLANDTDAEGSALTVGGGQPTHGAVAVNANGSFTYTPELNYYGSDSFTYRAFDGTALRIP